MVRNQMGRREGCQSTILLIIGISIRSGKATFTFIVIKVFRMSCPFTLLFTFDRSPRWVNCGLNLDLCWRVVVFDRRLLRRRRSARCDFRRFISRSKIWLVGLHAQPCNTLHTFSGFS